MPKVITIPPIERWNENKEVFEYPIGKDGTTITLEHSLVSIAKWEAKWHKPFLTSKKHTPEEALDYIKCMTLTQNVKDIVYSCITEDVMNEITDYIDDPMTATNFNNTNQFGGKKKKSIRDEQITAELVYYWMISYHIPFECRKWHFEQLMALIEMCSVKTEEANERAQNNGELKPKKLTPEQIANRQKLNEQRLKAHMGK